MGRIEFKDRQRTFMAGLKKCLDVRAAQSRHCVVEGLLLLSPGKSLKTISMMSRSPKTIAL